MKDASASGFFNLYPNRSILDHSWIDIIIILLTLFFIQILTLFFISYYYVMYIKLCVLLLFKKKKKNFVYYYLLGQELVDREQMEKLNLLFHFFFYK